MHVPYAYKMTIEKLKERDRNEREKKKKTQHKCQQKTNNNNKIKIEFIDVYFRSKTYLSSTRYENEKNKKNYKHNSTCVYMNIVYSFIFCDFACVCLPFFLFFSVFSRLCLSILSFPFILRHIIFFFIFETFTFTAVRAPLYFFYLDLFYIIFRAMNASRAFKRERKTDELSDSFIPQL